MQAQKDDQVKRQHKGSPMYAKRRGFRGNLHCWQFDLGLEDYRTMRKETKTNKQKTKLLLFKPPSLVFFFVQAELANTEFFSSAFKHMLKSPSTFFPVLSHSLPSISNSLHSQLSK